MPPPPPEVPLAATPVAVAAVPDMPVPGPSQGGSAASMATEILSLSPHEANPDASADGAEQLVVTQDLTITGKARKKRFRLR